MNKHSWSDRRSYIPRDWLLHQMIGYIFDNRMAKKEGKHRREDQQ